MTPFDPDALLAMLLAFYPTPSPASLVRARQERPDYFAGGVLIGRGPDALRLPDGRILDLIFDWDGLHPRWQVIDVTLGGGGAPEAFPLEPGPLAPLDGAQVPGPVERHTFEDLLARHAGELVNTDGAVALAEGVLVGAATPDGLDATFEATVAAAGVEIDGQLGSIHTLDPSDLLVRTDGHGHVIDAEDGQIPPPDGAPAELGQIDPGAMPAEDAPPPQEL
ncbi:MAG: hypothetical protein ACRDH5_00030 [bacterium]